MSVQINNHILHIKTQPLAGIADNPNVGLVWYHQVYLVPGQPDILLGIFQRGISGALHCMNGLSKDFRPVHLDGY
jgi:hypothetical protein